MQLLQDISTQWFQEIALVTQLERAWLIMNLVFMLLLYISHRIIARRNEIIRDVLAALRDHDPNYDPEYDESDDPNVREAHWQRRIIRRYIAVLERRPTSEEKLEEYVWQLKRVIQSRLERKRIADMERADREKQQQLQEELRIEGLKEEERIDTRRMYGIKTGYKD